MKHSTNKIILVFAIILTIANARSFAQDQHFSQFRETPVLINPAQTALNKDIRVIMNYKDQWRSVTSPYKTFAFSTECAINHKKNKDNYITMGLQFLNDKAGDSQMKTTKALLSLNGILKITKTQKLALGIIGGIAQNSINYNGLKWGSQYDGTNYNSAITTTEPIGVNSFIYSDIGAGVVWNYGKEQKYINAKDGIRATVGFSAFHFGLPKYSYYKKTGETLNTKFIAHANMEINLTSKNLILIPELLYAQQGSLFEVNTGIMFKYLLQESSKYTDIKNASAYALGIHYRVRDAIIATALYEYSNYAIGISYDVNISKLRSVSNFKGGFEITLRFVTPSQFRKTKARF